METKIRRGPAELETARMAAVLSASYPRGWRVRMWYEFGLAMRCRAVVTAERFDGAVWREFTRLADSGWSEDREIAFAGVLGLGVLALAPQYRWIPGHWETSTSILPDGRVVSSMDWVPGRYVRIR